MVSGGKRELRFCGVYPQGRCAKRGRGIFSESHCVLGNTTRSRRILAHPRSVLTFQVNKVTSYLDLSVVYGSDGGRANVLRAGKNGKLLHQPDNDIINFNSAHAPNLNLLSCPRDKLLVSGDNRVNVQPGMIVQHTLWSREHNLICDELLKHPGNEDMDDEALFHHARALTRAKFQKIVWNEFLPSVIGVDEFEKLGSYRGYDSSLRVGIFNEFATAAFRFGHSQVGDTLLRLDENWTMTDSGHLSMRDAYFNPGRILREGGIEPLVRGMLVQKAQNVDTLFSDAVRNFLFGTNTMGLDLASIGIQRGRDHGLPDYNAVREAVGLPKRKSFAEVTPDEKVRLGLAEVYASVDDIDLWVGGLAEAHVHGGCVGETFARIIARQYGILRDGDRFWFENSETALYNLKDRNSLPTKGTTMNEIIYRNTGIHWGDRKSPFHSRDMWRTNGAKTPPWPPRWGPCVSIFHCFYRGQSKAPWHEKLLTCARLAYDAANSG